MLPLFGSSQSTLIFSEYGEGSSNNKWVEIYNPTFQNISLDEYRYNFCWNGCDSLEWEFSIPFDSGHIMLPGGTYLLVHHNADSILLNTANQTTNILGIKKYAATHSRILTPPIMYEICIANITYVCSISSPKKSASGGT